VEQERKVKGKGTGGIAAKMRPKMIFLRKTRHAAGDPDEEITDVRGWGKVSNMEDAGERDM
jgi:hypothetical protein